MYDVHIEVKSLVYIYVYVGSRTIFFPVVEIHCRSKSNWILNIISFENVHL